MAKDVLLNFVRSALRKSKSMEMLAYFVQNIFRINTQGEGSFGQSEEQVFEYYCSVLDTYIDLLGESAFRQKTIMEIGSGISLCGMLEAIRRYDVKHVYCYDRYNRISVDYQDILVKRRLDQYQDRITYLTGEPEIICDSVSAGSVDTVLSNAVLEFVPDISRLFTCINACTTDDAVGFHRIDLKCHNKFKQSGELYFHTFRRFVWNCMGSNIGQLNRISAGEFDEYFLESGFEIFKSDKKMFPDHDLEEAKKYLSSDLIHKYRFSDADFVVRKKAQ